MSGYGSGENSEKRVMEGIEEKRKREAQELNARKQKNNILYKRQTWRNAYRNATLRLLNLTGKGFKKNNTKIIFGKTKKS
jgi:hypothetical protein